MVITPSADYEKKKQLLLQEFGKHASSASLSKTAISLKKQSSNLFRNRKQKETKKLDVRQLNQVISIDPENRIAEVEAMITFEELVDATLKHNLLPAVVPELKTITVGGALVGLGIESSSFRYGLVHETILEIEVLAGDGNVYTCRPDNGHRDLFFAFPNSYGTLGYALKVKLKLIPAKKYVKLTNLRFSDVNSYFDTLHTLCTHKRTEKTDSYIDGVIFNKNEMYIIIGDFIDEVPEASNYTYMSAYYKSIPKKDIQYLTAYDYIWRWDADWFWCSKHFGMQQPLLRLLFGKFMLRSRVYWKIKHLMATNPFLKLATRMLEKPSESVIQDILIPIHKASEFLSFFHQDIGITPIWICPFQSYQPDREYPLCKLDPKQLYVDFGFWDIVPTDLPKGTLNRAIEQKTQELGGFKSLYSDSYYTEQEFWQIYSKETFSQLKRKYDPRAIFKDLYQKCVK